MTGLADPSTGVVLLELLGIAGLFGLSLVAVTVLALYLGRSWHEEGADDAAPAQAPAEEQPLPGQDGGGARQGRERAA